jgi:hypothetical protein
VKKILFEKKSLFAYYLLLECDFFKEDREYYLTLILFGSRPGIICNCERRRIDN